MFNVVYRAILNTGIKDPLLYLSQIGQETGNVNFTSKVSKADNNFSGIKFANQPGATRGTKVTEYGHTSYYAHFDTVQDWANAYYKILKRIGALEATTTDELAHILKLGKYYEAPEKDYARGLKYFYTKLKAKLIANEIVDTVKKNETPILGTIATGVAIALIVKYLSNGK